MLDILRFAAIYLLPFLLILTIVVTIHELGHFWAARIFGVAVDRFSIGFGRPIVSWTDRRGVDWRVGWIPLGGYVRFGGDTNDASVPDADDLEALRRHIVEKEGPEAVHKYYHFKPVWQRAIIAAAGPAANFVLAIAIFTVLFSSLEVMKTRPLVGAVAEGSPAAAAGFQPGDLIKAANGRPVSDFQDFALFVQLRAGESIEFTVERDGVERVLTATPRRVQSKDPLTGAMIQRGLLGLQSSPEAVYYKRYPPHEAVVEGIRAVGKQVGASVTYIGRIFQGKENGDQFSGVVGIANVSGSVTKTAINQSESAGGVVLNTIFMLVQLTAAISIGIGFANLLPIPVLDGGHLAFYAYEAVARKPVNAGVQAASYRVGLALVVGLMLFLTWNDLQRLQAFEFLGGLFS